MPLLTPEEISAEAAAVRQFVVANLIGKRTTYLPMSRASYTSDKIDWLYLRYRVAAFNTGIAPFQEPNLATVYGVKL